MMGKMKGPPGALPPERAQKDALSQQVNYSVLTTLPEAPRQLYLAYLKKWPEPVACQNAYCDFLRVLPEDEQIAALVRRFNRAESVSNSKVFRGPALARCDSLIAPPAPHAFIIEDMVPISNGVLVAPGGVGKTTVTVWEAIHIILGRNVWGHKVLHPGGVLFLTAEDTRDDFMYRLYMLMDAMCLTPVERRLVTQGIYIEDVTQRIVRLAELNRDGNIIMSAYVDELCAHYAGEGMAMVNIDPLSHFGPGERFVNDAEAVMCQVSRRLSDELDAHVRLIHHTGKAVERTKIVDQYAGRNGSSLADNSRLIMQLVADDDKIPASARKMLQAGYLPLQMHFHKVSYATKPQYPVWLLRKGWSIKEFSGEPINDDETQQQELQKIVEYLNAKLDRGVYCSLNTLQTDCKTVGVTKARITLLVDEALQTGKLLELSVPEDKKQGRLTKYLSPTGREEPLGGLAAD